MITIVSGLPRSGTSMMMQMLEAGGMEVLADHVRRPDKNNPRGYYEFEKVKRLKEDNSWLAEARGKAVKIISMLLYDLPPGYKYKIIFMTRNMDEILTSQQDMLEQRNIRDTGPDDAEMRVCFANHMTRLKRWLPRAGDKDVFYCDYNELLIRPAPIAEKIVRFLNVDLDSDCMVRIVDRSLYRHRNRTGRCRTGAP